jgi:hypothetical protein
MGEKPNEIMPHMYCWFLLQCRNGENWVLQARIKLHEHKTAFIKRDLCTPYFKQVVIRRHQLNVKRPDMCYWH